MSASLADQTCPIYPPRGVMLRGISISTIGSGAESVPFTSGASQRLNSIRIFPTGCPDWRRVPGNLMLAECPANRLPARSFLPYQFCWNVVVKAPTLPQINLVLCEQHQVQFPGYGTEFKWAVLPSGRSSGAPGRM